jgi:hypothetical protein
VFLGPIGTQQGDIDKLLRLMARGKNVNQVVVAIARTMAAFGEAIAREVEVAH